MDALKNPLAFATIANSKQGQQTISQITNAAKVALLIGGGVLAVNYGYGKYKEWRADKYARDNIGNPNLIAAAVIHESFTRFEFPGFLGWMLSDIDIATDEAALNQLASQVTNIKAVSDAYKILFDRTLSKDLQNGLDTEELQRFWNLIKSPSVNNESTLYPLGSRLYVAARDGILINQASNTSGTWIGTNNLYDQLKQNELVGEVVAHGVVNENMVANGGDAALVGQNYYIVKQIRFKQCLTNCFYGVVVQEQVTNKEL